MTVETPLLRACAWCEQPVPPGKRSDSECCSVRCRQARQRFRIAVGGATPASGPLRFAYADPPYPGFARKLYGKPEVDHAQLVLRLVREYPDGWALSTHARSLRYVLSLIPPALEPRTCIWVRGARHNKSAKTASNAWEPLIVVGGRARDATAGRLEDVLLWGAVGRQRSHPAALVGMKSAAFCEWLFRQLGATVGDSLDDLFPGSGAVTRAWHLFTRRASTANAVASRYQLAHDRLVRGNKTERIR